MTGRAAGAPFAALVAPQCKPSCETAPVQRSRLGQCRRLFQHRAERPRFGRHGAINAAPNGSL